VEVVEVEAGGAQPLLWLLWVAALHVVAQEEMVQ
jgi:hypothetical protein